LKELIEQIKSSIPLSLKAEEYLYSISKSLTVAKGSTLIREGQYVNSIYFIKEGNYN